MDVHQIDMEVLCHRLNTDLKKGLSKEEASKRRNKKGPNVLTLYTETPEGIKIIQKFFTCFCVSLWFCFLLCFLDVILSELIGIRLLLFENFLLGMSLLTLIVITSTISHCQERKNLKILESFNKLVPNYATVMRSGDYITIRVEDLVLGDIVEIKFGDRVPADLRIFESHNLKVDNSLLTGESHPQARSPEYTHENPLETHNLVFFATNTIEGIARGVVIACGDNTVLGRIAHLAIYLPRAQTPMAIDIKSFMCCLITSAYGLALFLFILAFILNFTYTIAFTILLGTILAMVPEGLFSTFSICFALAAARLAQNNCLVQNIEAIGTFGSVSTICLDKTGSLTQNRMTVSHLWINNRLLKTDTSEEQDNIKIDINDGTLQAMLQCAILCNSADFKGGQFQKPTQKKEVSGTASEAALIKFVEIVSGNTSQQRRNSPKLIEIPFNSANKFQLSIHELQDKPYHFLLLMKGAPDRIISRCATILMNGEIVEISTEMGESLQAAYIYLGLLGERVLGFCDYTLPKNQYPKNYNFIIEPKPNFPLEGFRFLGFISMIDPPRAAVPEIVAKCRSAGIRVIMITGDYHITAKAIAKSVGIITQPTIEDIAIERNLHVTEIHPREADACVVQGPDLKKNYTSDQLESVIKLHSEIIFTRTTPQQKLMIVESLQNMGEIVAVTGDGVNDSPALKRANISVSMCDTTTDVTKEVADIILLDDNFASIFLGIEEGRLIHENLKKSVIYILTSNMPETVPFLAIIVFKLPFLLHPLAILCIDICINLLPAITLSFEKPESDIMKHRPRNPFNERLISRNLVLLAYFQTGVIEAAAGLLTYFIIMTEHGFYPTRLFGIGHNWYNQYLNDVDDSLGQEWTYTQRSQLERSCHTGFFVAIVVTQWATLIISKTRRNSIFKQGMSNHALNFALFLSTIFALFLVYFPHIAYILDFCSIRLHYWFLAIPFWFLILFYDELRRYYIRKFPGSWIDKNTYF